MNTTKNADAATDELITDTTESVPTADGKTTNGMHAIVEPADDAHVEDESLADRSTGVVAGTAAVMGAGLSVASLTGTWVGTVLSDRQRLIGQINASSGSPTEQIEQIYGSAWHIISAVNGAFALTALLIVTFALAGVRSAPPWARAVAWGGLGLSLLGLLIAGVMWSDLFVDLPKVPTQTPT
ncbi:hypothetical protein [Streptomyces sp. NPDC053431]|uniref:hypothetical protein n=1 Tax=Streptomyces sp. NPDC053431 TaxID=3365703 RepID=UPI0037D2EC58